MGSVWAFLRIFRAHFRECIRLFSAKHEAILRRECVRECVTFHKLYASFHSND